MILRLPTSFSECCEPPWPNSTTLTRGRSRRPRRVAAGEPSPPTACSPWTTASCSWSTASRRAARVRGWPAQGGRPRSRSGFGFRGVAGERGRLSLPATGWRRPPCARPWRSVQAVARGHAGRDNVAPGHPGPPSTPALTRSPAHPGEPSWRCSSHRAILPRGREPARGQRHGDAGGVASGGGDLPRRRPAPDRSPSAGPAQRQRRGRAGRPAREAGHGGGGRVRLERLLEDGWWQGVVDEALRQALAAIWTRCRRRPAR